jgi:ABC-type polysaccharide/polyol phosphate transport system ATPase subunit
MTEGQNGVAGLLKVDLFWKILGIIILLFQVYQFFDRASQGRLANLENTVYTELKPQAYANKQAIAVLDAHWTDLSKTLEEMKATQKETNALIVSHIQAAK